MKENIGLSSSTLIHEKIKFAQDIIVIVFISEYQNVLQQNY